jgi:hypothetical protein
MPHEPDRTVSIASARLQPWVDNFRRRHGEIEGTLDGDTVTLIAADGAKAQIDVPFPPLAGGEPALESLLRHVATERHVGAILVRKGGYGVGVFSGARLLASKVGSSYVQGKTKAGGWSQQRYARRRDNQSRQAYDQAADEAARVLLPHLNQLSAVATGGDKAAVEAVLADPRLQALRPLVLPQVFPVPDPRLRVLQAFSEQFLALTIRLNELA